MHEQKDFSAAAITHTAFCRGDTNTTCCGARTHAHTHDTASRCPVFSLFFSSLLSYQRKDERWNPIRELPGCQCLAFLSWLRAFSCFVFFCCWVFFLSNVQVISVRSWRRRFHIEKPISWPRWRWNCACTILFGAFVFSKMRELIKTFHFEFSRLSLFFHSFIYLFILSSPVPVSLPRSSRRVSALLQRLQVQFGFKWRSGAPWKVQYY